MWKFTTYDGRTDGRQVMAKAHLARWARNWVYRGNNNRALQKLSLQGKKQYQWRGWYVYTILIRPQTFCSQIKILTCRFRIKLYKCYDFILQHDAGFCVFLITKYSETCLNCISLGQTCLNCISLGQTCLNCTSLGKTYLNCTSLQKNLS